MPISRRSKTKAAQSPSKHRPSPERGPTRPNIPKDFAVVGIGASAGGLEACRKLVDGLPNGNGIGFILIQHLDPTHESMMVQLLVSHTSMIVLQASHGMKVEPDHLYVIPPATYLSISNGILQLTEPQERHGARLPFDFLLHSLAKEYGPRAICVVLSGAGADGSMGLRTVKKMGGLVIVQDPEEAAYSGMPQSAIMTGDVDRVLPVAEIPKAITEFAERAALSPGQNVLPRNAEPSDWLPDIIELVRKNTAHDFSLYKEGTLRRRIERRMALLSIKGDEADRYLKILKSDAREIDLLAQDLLIHVTSFFRDRDALEHLATKIVPDMIHKQAPEQPLRIWIAGCSTGEEAYSLAMIFSEQIAASQRNVKVQIFASDVDPDAVARARDGFYPQSIDTDVSPARLAHFFYKDNKGYRVSPELRAMVIFTVQDVLKDPPFSRLDLISCRNLLIYLGTDAQEKVISIFHFALNKGGLLLLGSAETIGNANSLFEIVSKQERLYRHISRGGHRDVNFPIGSIDDVRVPPRPAPGAALTHQMSLADLTRRLVLESYSPAAILINSKRECLYSLGPIDTYLKVPPGHPIHDVLAMARDGLRTPLRSAIQQAFQTGKIAVIPDVRMNRESKSLAFTISAKPLAHEGEDLLLICFINEAAEKRKTSNRKVSKDAPHVDELEQELEVTRSELESAIRDLKLSGEEQRAINEEALSVNEEYQSANEELLTSKEELQSLNEELTALNYQLHETLEMQRATFDDLQNVLYSTNVATLFLDTNFKIRFFTPATKLLFSIIPTDIGRPLSDLNALTIDRSLSSDARTVLQNLSPIEREIEAPNKVWFIRRILPYRTHDGRVEGVVITFTDITERKNIAKALEAAKHQADMANAAKSRFLAIASHDLRQPLQTLSLLQGLLAKLVKDEAAQKLVARIEESLSTISSMLDTLLDINEIETGTIQPDIVTFPVNDLLVRLRDAFAYHAQAQKLELHKIPCGLSVRSDPRLLEQMIRNLLSNAFKFTRTGKVLLGCRRRAGTLSIEVWDTGIGIRDSELGAIFDDYHQVDNATYERGRGLGLGLSIVKRLAGILGLQVRVRSHLGRGSVFSIDIPLPPIMQPLQIEHPHDGVDPGSSEKSENGSSILVVEDDPEVRELLGLLLSDDGHQTTAAHNGITALALVAQGKVKPELILADYNLPDGMNGLDIIAKLREMLQSPIPGIILTGDISNETTRSIEQQNCLKLNKPVRLRELTQAVRRLTQLPVAADPGMPAEPAMALTGVSPVVIVIDDDRTIRDSIRSVLEDDGQTVEDYGSAETFLAAFQPGREVCLLVDATLPGMSGLDLLKHLTQTGHRLPAIMITGNGDVSMAVHAMKSGASDFIEKPVSGRDLIASIHRTVEISRDSSKLQARREVAARHLAGLTSRQHQILDMVLAGHPSKNIAADLGISQRTVENHRAAIMKKTGVKSLPALARLAVAATAEDPGEQ